MKKISRRKFVGAASAAAAGMATGCSTDPVTGKRGLMFVSESQEIQIDKQHSPHQFSSDYGVTQDRTLNNYLAGTGRKMAALTHRPKMPYSFRGVNATYINAYAFPGGSIACTRGILLAMKNEAELAALLGHELGHVCARHSAERMSKGIVTSALVKGLASLAGSDKSAMGQAAQKLGMLGAGALLASYSRENEREADALGLEYMVKSGYNAAGFVGLMDLLRSMSKHKPGALELMFSTHPMSDERYQTAVASVKKYDTDDKRTLYRERYMDNTASLRKISGAIEDMQRGSAQMAGKKYPQAEAYYKKALKQAPEDYAGLCMMARCLLIQNKNKDAGLYVETAKAVYGQEAQCHHLAGLIAVRTKKYDEAYQEFERYNQLLPGNPGNLFYRGYSLEGLKRIREAGDRYEEYLKIDQRSEQAKHAYSRLVQWGRVRQQ